MPPRSKSSAVPTANAAVLLVPAFGLDRGNVIRGAAKAIGDLVEGKTARPATERDIAVAGAQVRDLADLG